MPSMPLVSYPVDIDSIIRWSIVVGLLPIVLYFVHYYGFHVAKVLYRKALSFVRDGGRR